MSFLCLRFVLFRNIFPVLLKGQMAVGGLNRKYIMPSLLIWHCAIWNARLEHAWHVPLSFRRSAMKRFREISCGDRAVVLRAAHHLSNGFHLTRYCEILWDQYLNFLLFEARWSLLPPRRSPRGLRWSSVESSNSTAPRRSRSKQHWRPK